MSDAVIIAGIGFAQVLAVGYFAWQQRKQGEHLQDIKKATDGMQSRLEVAAKAEGVLEEKQRTEQKP